MPRAARTIPNEAVLRGAYWAAGYLAVTGIITVLLPNTLFIRMTPIVWVDYALWPVSALLIGAFMTLRHATAMAGTGCNVAAGTGGVAAFLGFSCPVCNKVLLLLLGTGGVLTFVEPYRTFIGLAGIVILLIALVAMWRAHQASARYAPGAPEDASDMPARA